MTSNSRRLLSRRRSDATRRRKRLGVDRVDDHGVVAAKRTATDAVATEAPAGERRGAGRLRTRMRCGRSSMSSRMARKSPSAARRPARCTSTREPNRSTSSSTWLDTITHLPCCAESMEQIDDVDALAGVEAGERFVEHEHLGIVHDRLGDLDPLSHALRVGATRRVSCSRVRLSDARCSRFGRILAVLQEAVSRTNSKAVSDSNSTPAADQPDLARSTRSRRGSWPRTRTDALRRAGQSRHIIRSMVDLPAPLGPSSAVTPCPTSKDTSETATTSPNHFDTASTAMTASAVVAAPRSAARSTCHLDAVVPEPRDHAEERVHPEVGESECTCRELVDASAENGRSP